jgi:uncharacterized protein (DUF4415 family)
MVAAGIDYFQKCLGKRGGICVSRHEGNLTTPGCGNRQAESSGYSDIPPLTDEQLSQFRRAPNVRIAARLDRDIYDWLKRYGEGYSTRINDILCAVMSRAR